jgi:hypothetical protein
VNALLVEFGNAIRPRHDGLPGASVNAHLLAAPRARARIEERDVIGEPRGSLHFATHEQGILVRDEE